jgi:hypothetical protein
MSIKMQNTFLQLSKKKFHMYFRKVQNEIREEIENKIKNCLLGNKARDETYK